MTRDTFKAKGTPPCKACEDEVVCLECGHPMMPMGQVCQACYACLHPADDPAEAQAQGGGEVVAEVCEDQSGSKYMCWSPGLTPLPPAGTKLYTAPPSAPGCGACADGCKDRGSCRVRDESPPSAPVGVDGTWLWCKLMDWCRSQRIAPATQNKLFAIAGEAHRINALAQQPAAVDGAVLRKLRDYFEGINNDEDGDDYRNLSADAMDLIDSTLAAQPKEQTE